MVCEALSLPRIIYGQALLEWYKEISKLSTDHHSFKDESDPNLTFHERGHGHSRHEIIERKVLNCLKDGPLDTLTIAKKVYGGTVPNRPVTGRRAMTAILYRMASEGKIIHHKDGDLHTWELTSSEVMIPIVVPIGRTVAMA